VRVNLVVIDGTFYGDTCCGGCVTDGVDAPLIQLRPLPRGFDEDEEAD